MSGSASIQSANTWMDLLLRQSYPAQQVGIARVGTQGVELEIDLQTQQIGVTLLIGSVEPFECLIFVSQIGIECGIFAASGRFVS